MAKYPNAIWKEITGSVGKYFSGPYKIVHHTTEGSSAEGAMRTYKIKRCDPHFTVDDTQIYQHIDTEECARALRSDTDKLPHTNRDSAVQIELVGFAHLPKPRASLENLARLLRWLEAEHVIPRKWPNGYPKPATAQGGDPGNHNRDPKTWNSESGHYGHCHVPENTHWDPAYTQEEVEFLMTAEFDDDGNLIETDRMQSLSSALRAAEQTFDGVISTMPDHGDVE